MEDLQPPFLFATASGERRRLGALKEAGRIHAIGPRLYSSLPKQQVARATRAAWASIVAGLYPDALLGHRTALDYRPDPDGVVFLTATTNRRVEYPGLTLQFVRGPGPLDDDPAFLGLRASSLPRALLENLSIDPRRAVVRTAPIATVEHRLEQLLRDGGAIEVNRLRDRARVIATTLGWAGAFERLDAIIGALSGTRPADAVTSPGARARAIGEPFDTACFERLQLLFGELQQRALTTAPETRTTAAHLRHKAFFEAYFSNYIEGTRFEIEEAEAIVFDRQIPAARPKDAHDIVGTFAVVSDPVEMRRTPSSSDELVELLRARHLAMLSRRPEAEPGVLKTKPNRAGETVFVSPEYVRGTLGQGHALYSALPRGLPRAIFMMFLVADVHPFADGNGRLARVMMNAELVAAGASTIIVPTVFRDDYLTALRALTRRHRPTPLVDALRRAAAFSHLDFTAYPRALAELQRRNWFREPDEARIVDAP